MSNFDAKFYSVVLGTALAAVISTSVFAGPSAKFAATWTDWPALASVAVIKDATMDPTDVDSKIGYTLARIKVPQNKELLVGVSAEIGLFTKTSIKGKKGGSATALADAAAYVTIFAVPIHGGSAAEAAPGLITLSKRVQVLNATLGGVIESCTDANDDGTIDIKTECLVSDEEIGLLLDTVAAHHFNFVLPNMDQGEYNIKAVFSTGARANIVANGGAVSASSDVKAIINRTMVTVQQVRAAKGGVIDTDIIEP